MFVSVKRVATLSAKIPQQAADCKPLLSSNSPISKLSSSFIGKRNALFIESFPTKRPKDSASHDLENANELLLLELQDIIQKIMK